MKIAARFLSKQFHVVSAYNGQEALDIYRARKKAGQRLFDVVLTDINMPVMNGVELAKLLRQEGHRGGIVALTGDIDRSTESLQQAGFDRVLIKPVLPKQILEALDGLLSLC